VDTAIQITTVLKKALEVLLSNKDGRKFIGYVIGIAVFILLLPVIMLYGLFGWMAGSNESSVLNGSFIDNIPQENISVINQMDVTCNNISVLFQAYNLSKNDIEKAKLIYLSYLVGRETESNFYDELAYCFLNTNESILVYDLVSERFLVSISAEDREKIENIKYD
jgi:hypothetical protein